MVTIIGAEPPMRSFVRLRLSHGAQARNADPSANSLVSQPAAVLTFVAHNLPKETSWPLVQASISLSRSNSAALSRNVLHLADMARRAR
jgi:hypothetical protein